MRFGELDGVGTLGGAGDFHIHDTITVNLKRELRGNDGVDIAMKY